MGSELIRVKHSFFFLPASQTPSEPIWQPPTDIYQTRRGWLVKFDLAGVRPEDVQLNVSGSRLTVRGIRRDWSLEDGCQQYQMEISYSQFERSVTLPTTLDKAKLVLEHRDGMLLVDIQLEANI